MAMSEDAGKTLRRKRAARKRAITLHRQRVTDKLTLRAYLKHRVAVLERLEDREPSDETHKALIGTKARLREVQNQLRAFGDVDIV